jgi:hypothetical protein
MDGGFGEIASRRRPGGTSGSRDREGRSAAEYVSLYPPAPTLACRELASAWWMRRNCGRLAPWRTAGWISGWQNLTECMSRVTIAAACTRSRTPNARCLPATALRASIVQIRSRQQVDLVFGPAIGTRCCAANVEPEISQQTQVCWSSFQVCASKTCDPLMEWRRVLRRRTTWSGLDSLAERGHAHHATNSYTAISALEPLGGRCPVVAVRSSTDVYEQCARIDAQLESSSTNVATGMGARCVAESAGQSL